MVDSGATHAAWLWPFTPLALVTRRPPFWSLGQGAEGNVYVLAMPKLGGFSPAGKVAPVPAL